MPTVRLIHDRYTQPLDWDNPHRDATRERIKGEVFDVGDAEYKRLCHLEAVEDYHGADDPDAALIDLLESQLKRMREDHDRLCNRQGGVHQREIDLSQARLREAERSLEHARKGRPARELTQQRPDGTTSPGPVLPSAQPDPGGLVAVSPEAAAEQGDQGQAKGSGSKGSSKG